MTRMPMPLANTDAVPPGPHPYVIGVDPSLTQTGWCVLEVPALTVAAEHIIATTPDTPRPERLATLRNGLHQAVSRWGAVGGLVAMESEVFLGTGRQSGDASAVQAVLQVRLWELGARYLPVNPMHVKRWVGAAEKVQMLLQVFKVSGRTYTNHNAADAYVIALVGAAYWMAVQKIPARAALRAPQAAIVAKLIAAGLPWEGGKLPQRGGRPRRATRIEGGQ